MAELKEAFPGVETKLIASSGGAFEVLVDGKLVYSKKRQGRHAAAGELVKLIRAL